jgi:hypothetical protein
MHHPRATRLRAEVMELPVGHGGLHLVSSAKQNEETA